METCLAGPASPAEGWFTVPAWHGPDRWRALAVEAGYLVRRLRALPSVALSARTLERIFHRRFGAAPAMMLQHWRAEAARDHILHTGATNKETAAEFGFADEAHLCHAFKRFFDRSPQSFSPARLAVVNRRPAASRHLPFTAPRVTSPGPAPSGLRHGGGTISIRREAVRVHID